MSGITFCPKCQQPVSLPAHIHANAFVQCPICHAEYAMHEAIPPELIPLTKPTNDPLEWPKELVGATTAVDQARLEEQENEAAAVVERISLGMTHLQKHKKAWWRAPLEVVFGGLAGLLIAYYGLAAWLGPDLPRKGFPVVTSLPGITWLTSPPASEHPSAHRHH
jgi:hypothetical protein